MINFNFNIDTPYKKYTFESFYSFHKQLSEYKVFELQLMNNPKLIEVDFHLNLRGLDHPGVSLELTLFTYTVSLMIYDTRHEDALD